jgi:hypothetical protein
VGDDVANGVSRLLDIFEAQGRRQRIGSQTSFNTLALQDLERGTPIGRIGEAAATGALKLPQMAREAIQRWRMGSNLDTLARLATDPNAAGLFRRLARETNGARAAQTINRLVSIATRGAGSGSRAPAAERR